MKLTDIKCKSAKPSAKSVKMSDGGGMYLEVMPNGSKYWRFKYRIKIEGKLKEKRLAIGVYPEISLKEARERRDAAKRLLEQGKDPSLEKKKKKVQSQESSINTFRVIALEWFDNRKGMWSERYADGVLTRLENDVFSQIGDYPITEIEPPILLQAIRRIENRGAQELARRQLQKCGEIFRYAIACGKATRDPSSDIKEALRSQTKGHFAAIDTRDLPDFLKAIDRNDARLYRNTQNALRLIMLTFVRTSELINASWEEIDFERKEWVIPAERMKMKKEHIVPLSRQAIAILGDQKEIAGQWPLVFPSSVRPKQSISNNTILGA